jgi:hypothetical protein
MSAKNSAAIVNTTISVLQILQELYPLYLEARKSGGVSVEEQARVDELSRPIADGTFFDSDEFKQD